MGWVKATLVKTTRRRSAASSSVGKSSCILRTRWRLLRISNCNTTRSPFPWVTSLQRGLNLKILQRVASVASVARMKRSAIRVPIARRGRRPAFHCAPCGLLFTTRLLFLFPKCPSFQGPSQALVHFRRRIETGLEDRKGFRRYADRHVIVRFQAREQLVRQATVTSSPRRAAFMALMVFSIGMSLNSR